MDDPAVRRQTPSADVEGMPLRSDMHWKRSIIRGARKGTGALAIAAGRRRLRRPTLPSGLSGVGDSHVGPTGSVGEARVATEVTVQLAERLALPSLSLAASRAGGVAWQTTHGYADLARRTPAVPTTAYLAGSISKPVTATLLGRLVEGGRIALDQTVGHHLGQAAGYAGPATVRHLAGHTAGVRHFAERSLMSMWHEQVSLRAWRGARHAARLYTGEPLLFTPGDDFLYSTPGYTILGAVLEAATGRDYLDLLLNEVAAPLDLCGVEPDDGRRRRRDRAVSYVRVHDRYVDPPRPHPSYKWPGGGLTATPTDLVEIAASLMNHSFLSAETVSAFWTPQPLGNGRSHPEGYGMGWATGSASDRLGLSEPVPTVHHGCTAEGGTAFLLLLPSHNVAVSAMTNLQLRPDRSTELRDAVYRLAGELVSRG